ncbi:MAG: NlpC/P60 family protein [Bacteroidota bacterium]
MGTIISISEKPRRKPGLFFSFGGKAPTAFVRGSLAAVLLLLAGCGGASPRFKSGSTPSATRAEPAQQAPGEKPVEEDRETKSEEGEKILSGARSFKTEKNTSISNLDQARMMRQLSRWMGVPYKLGGGTEDGIDCSAYTMLIYKNSIGRQLPRSSAEQFRVGRAVEYSDLKFGDLVFFNTTGEPASHVGIYMGDDLFAHASVGLGVTVSSIESFYFKKRYEGARRIVE